MKHDYFMLGLICGMLTCFVILKLQGELQIEIQNEN